jgi:hypothetical protein
VDKYFKVSLTIYALRQSWRRFLTWENLLQCKLGNRLTGRCREWSFIYPYHKIKTFFFLLKKGMKIKSCSNSLFYFLLGGGADVPIDLWSLRSGGGNYSQGIGSCSYKVGKQIRPCFGGFTISYLQLCSGICFPLCLQFSFVTHKFILCTYFLVEFCSCNCSTVHLFL